MRLKHLAIAAGVALAALAAPALAQRAAVCDPTAPTYCAHVNANGGLQTGGGIYGGQTATLLSGVNAPTTGAWLAHVYKDSYLLTCVATSWNAATATLQQLGPDGTTALGFSPAVMLMANGTVGVGVGANASIRVVVTGSPTNLTCALS